MTAQLLARTILILYAILLLSLSSSIAAALSLHEQQQRRQVKTQPFELKSETQPKTFTKRSYSRRSWIHQATTTVMPTVLLLPLNNAAQAASPPPNPLNLKGTFWETGEIYVKKESNLPSDPADIIPSIKELIASLDSLESLVLDGKFDDLSRQLRGKSISESQLRVLGYALLDLLPENDDETNYTYLAEQAFRVALNRFIRLDALVETTARQQKVDRGLVETLGRAAIAPLSVANEALLNGNTNNNRNDIGTDSRIQVLASLGETTKAFKAFVKAADDALSQISQ
mmetsp:Transcript_13913/g.20540  ORF Transcript_13913/g.20540 Transcript_13913/m.20540 type:complete len:286 (-) Transcript_13913:24-881(-)